MKINWSNSLFIIGLILVIVVFVIANDQWVPLVSELIYKDIHNMEYGFKDLSKEPIAFEEVSERCRAIKKGDGLLKKGDRGFKELSKLILKDLSRSESKLFANTWSGTMSYENFRSEAFRVGFSKLKFQGIPSAEGTIHVPVGNNRINAYLNNNTNQYASFFVFKIAEEIQDKREFRPFVYATILFAISVLLTLIKFLRGRPSQ